MRPVPTLLTRMSASGTRANFYQDEVDIDMNPKIGAEWMHQGQQKHIATPGQNQKHYRAGALHSGTGKIHYVSGSSKNSDVFIRLLVV